MPVYAARRRHSVLLLGTLAGPVWLSGCAASDAATTGTATKPLDPGTVESLRAGPVFEAATADVIPFEDRSRRKWGNPIVADFDQDGRMDLLLTEHGRAAQLYWNEGGTFTEPVNLVHGDTHGVTVGDYDRDGRMDLVVSRGGGDGSNPRNPVHFHVNADRSIDGGEEFADFERSRGRAAKLVDADNNGTLDLLLTAFPLDSQPDGANLLHRNTGDGAFVADARLPQARWMGFRALTTDFNGDGIVDYLFYGGENMVAVQGAIDGGFEDVSETVLAEAAETSFAHTVTEIDFDNDGDSDLFITRADHPFEMETYFDAEHQRFAFFARREPIAFDDLTIDGDLRVENLQMAYPHFDVMVGAERRVLEFEVERHGHKEFTLAPEEAEGFPDDTSAPGLYVGHLGDGVWRFGGETDSPTACVVCNVTSTPATIEKPALPARLLENRDGVFVDVTQDLGVAIDEQTANAVAGDFDNDGWVDLFVLRYGDMAKANEQVLYLNRGGNSFERAEGHGLISPEVGATGCGADAFDYDGDGDLDLIFSNERGRWHLYTNRLDSEPQANHRHLIVDVGPSPEHAGTPRGAVVTIEADGDTQHRTVGASSTPFGQSLDTHLHFGLGARRSVDCVHVTWSNGEQATVEAVAPNQMIRVGRPSR